MHTQRLLVRSHNVCRQLKIKPILDLELRDSAPEEHPSGIVIDLVLDFAVELGAEEVDITVQIPPFRHLALGHHLHTEIIGLAEVNRHTVEHAVILVSVMAYHIGSVTIIGREVEARLVPKMDVAQLVAVHIGGCQRRIAHTNVAVVVVGTERAHLPEARTTDAARVAHLELVELIHRIVQVGAREEVKVRLASIDRVVAVVGIMRATPFLLRDCCPQ